MIWHPLVWAFWAATISGGMLYTAAAVRAMDVAANWSPGSADPDQLRRERRAETASLLGHGAMGCLTAAALMGLIGVALAWHRIVPGAMCGTGVLQAMGSAGYRAMLFWAVTMALIYGWQVMDRLDRHAPEGGLIQTHSRVLLTAAPFLTLALFYSWQALMRINAAPPVSCCAAVYDRVLGNAAGSQIMRGLSSVALWSSLMGRVVVPAAAILTASRSAVRLPGVLITAMAMGWSVLAVFCVKHTWSSYYYQVLSHPCPWCLFLPDYHGAGFLIFACLGAVGLEGVAFWAADHTRQMHPGLADPASRRLKMAAWRILAAMAGFTLLTIGPALAWRLQNGVWMNGTF